jgi:hypothetical protein
MHEPKPSLVVERRAPFALTALLLLAAGAYGCSSGSSPYTCSAQNCSGCCAQDGQCETGTANSACGQEGATCSICTGIQTCTNALCVPAGPIFDAGPTQDAGTGLVLSVNNFDAWCSVTVNSEPLSLSGTYTFDAGTAVNLDAATTTGFVWDYWLGTDGANAGNGGHDPHMATTVTMDANKNVLACCDNSVEKCPTSLP